MARRGKPSAIPPGEGAKTIEQAMERTREHLEQVVREQTAFWVEHFFSEQETAKEFGEHIEIEKMQAGGKKFSELPEGLRAEIRAAIEEKQRSMQAVALETSEASASKQDKVALVEEAKHAKSVKRLVTLAEELETMGAKEEAIAAYTAAFKKGSRLRKVFERLVQLRLDLGQVAGAQRFLDEVYGAVKTGLLKGVKEEWLSKLEDRVPAASAKTTVRKSAEPEQPVGRGEKTPWEQTVEEWVEHFFSERKEAERIGATFSSLEDAQLLNGQSYAELNPRMKGDITEALEKDPRYEEIDEHRKVIREVPDTKGWSVFQEYEDEAVDHEREELIEEMRNPPSAAKGASGRGKREKGEALKPPLPEEEVGKALLHRFERAGIYIGQKKEMPVEVEVATDMTPEEQLIEAQEQGGVMMVTTEKPIDEMEQWLDEWLQRFREETQPIRASLKDATIEQCEQLLFEERPGAQWGKIEEIAERYDGLDHKTLRAINDDIEHYAQEYATPKGFVEYWKDYVARILAKDEQVQKEVQETIALMRTSARERLNELRGEKRKGSRKELKEEALMDEIRQYGLDPTLSFDAWMEKEMGPVYVEFDEVASAIEAEIRNADKDKCQTLLQGGPDSIHDRFLRVFPSARTQALLEKGERIGELLARLKHSKLEPISSDANPVKTREGWEQYLERISRSFLEFVRDVSEEQERLRELTEQKLARLEQEATGQPPQEYVDPGEPQIVRMSEQELRGKLAAFGFNPDEESAAFRARLDGQLAETKEVLEQIKKAVLSAEDPKELEEILGLADQKGNIRNACAWIDAIGGLSPEFDQFTKDLAALKPSDTLPQTRIDFWRTRIDAFIAHRREVAAEVDKEARRVQEEAEQMLIEGMAVKERKVAIERTAKDHIRGIEELERKYGHNPFDVAMSRAERLIFQTVACGENGVKFKEREQMLRDGKYAEVLKLSEQPWEDRLRTIEKEIPAMLAAVRHFATRAEITDEDLARMQQDMTKERKKDGAGFSYVGIGRSMTRRHERFLSKLEFENVSEEQIEKALKDFEQEVATLPKYAATILRGVPDHKRASVEATIEQWFEAADLLEGVRQHMDSRKHDTKEDARAQKIADRRAAWEEAHGENAKPAGHWKARIEFFLHAMAENSSTMPLLGLEYKAAAQEEQHDDRWRRLRAMFFSIVEKKGVSVPGMAQEDLTGEARIPLKYDHVVYREPGATRDTHVYGFINGLYEDPTQPLVIDTFDPLTGAPLEVGKTIPPEWFSWQLPRGEIRYGRIEFAAPKSLDGKVSIDLLRLAGMKIYDRAYSEISGSRRNLFLVLPGEVEKGSALAANTGGTNGPGFTGAARQLTERTRGPVLPDKGSAEWKFEEWNELLRDGKPIPDDFFKGISADDLVLFIDHHTRLASKDTSGTKYLYQLLDAMQCFTKFTEQERAALTQAVKFVTYDDNKSHPQYLGKWWEEDEGENWKAMAPRTLLGMARFMTLDTLMRVYMKYGASEETDTQYLSDEDLQEFGLEGSSARQEDLVLKAERDLNALIDGGHVLWNTKYGPVVTLTSSMDQDGNLRKQFLTEGINVIAAKMGVGAIMYWDHVRSTMFFSTTGNPIAKIPDWMRGKLGDIEVLRGTMVIGKNMKTGLKDFVRIFLVGEEDIKWMENGALDQYMDPDDPSGEAAQRWQYRSERLKMETDPTRLWDTLPHLYGVPVPLEVKQHGGSAYAQVPDWWRITRNRGVERVQVEIPDEMAGALETIEKERWRRYYIIPTEVYDDPVEGRRVVIARLEGDCGESETARALEEQVKVAMIENGHVPEDEIKNLDNGTVQIPGDRWLPYYREIWDDYKNEVEGGSADSGEEGQE